MMTRVIAIQNLEKYIGQDLKEDRYNMGILFMIIELMLL